MSLPLDKDGLPDSASPDLCLSHPTPEECVKIWTSTSASWKDALTLPVYLEESQFLTTVPLAKNGGMTTWILVDRSLPPNERPILCSCESFRKRSLTSDAQGNGEDNIVHGIASVFCPPDYRRRGYAARHMTEIAKVLRNWQSENARCVGSILYSDIGKSYYTSLGWHPNLTNSHLVFRPLKILWASVTEEILEGDLEKLCERDEIMVRAAMAAPTNAKKRLTIIPDLDHMLWHIGKEEFVTRYLFGKVPRAKGAIAGPSGSQVWAIWTHRYYDHPETEKPNNVLYILRLVVEGESTPTPCSAAEEEQHTARQIKQRIYLKAVLRAAQAQAAEWKLDCVKLWDPSPLVRDMMKQSEIEHSVVEREEDSIASGMWYGIDGGIDPAPQWLNNEHYAWL
ncbi:hypothetical protein MMC10_006093 [Thelotrema lepadinum]|nr:hypothetical protein [Thelotrema lepadinum]